MNVKLKPKKIIPIQQTGGGRGRIPSPLASRGEGMWDGWLVADALTF